MTAPLPAADLAELKRLAEAATPGPWRWNLNTKAKTIHLESQGRCSMLEFVMDFARWGMSGAAPRFRNTNTMALATKWACSVPGREHHAHWYQTVNHPDAAYIAAANPQAILSLLAQLEAQAARIAELEPMHTTVCVDNARLAEIIFKRPEWRQHDEAGAELIGHAQRDNATRIVACVNALAGVDDPAAAIEAAREALEWYRDAVAGVNTRDLFIGLGGRARRALALLGAKP